MKIETVKKLKVPFLMSLVILATFMFALFYQTFSLARLAKADVVTVHKFNIDKFVDDFKWTTYSYENVGGISPNWTEENATYSSATEMRDTLANVYGITYDRALIDSTKKSRILVSDSTGANLRVNYNELKQNVDCDLIEVQLSVNIDNAVSFYSMMAKVNNDDCVIDFSKLPCDVALVYSINFYKTKTTNGGKTGLTDEGSGSWQLGLNLPQDVSDLKLYSEYFIPCNGYSLMYSAFMSNGAGAIGNALGAFYGTVDALNLTSEPTYILPSGGFPNSTAYQSELASFNANYNRYNTAYKTMINADGAVDYAGTNLDAYYGYDFDEEIDDSSISVEPSTSVEPSASVAPSISVEPSASVAPSTSVEPSASDDQGTETPETDIVVTVQDYDGNVMGSIVVGEDKRITMEELQYVVNGAFDMPLKWESFDVKTLTETYFDVNVDIENNITLSPAECDITVYDENDDLVVKFDVEYGATINEDFVNDKIGNDFSSKYFIKAFDEILPFNFESQILYDLKLYPVKHNVKICVDDDTLVNAVVRSGAVIDVDFITEQLTKKSADKVYAFNVEHIDVIDSKKGYSHVAVGYAVDSEYTVDVYVWLSDVVESEVEKPEEPTPSSEDGKPTEDDNGNIPTDEVGESGCTHDFAFKPFEFPCTKCDVTFWAYLWSRIKGSLGLIVGIASVIVIGFVAVFLIRR